jgi:cell division protein FtsB
VIHFRSGPIHISLTGGTARLVQVEYCGAAAADQGMMKAVKAILLPGVIGALILYFSYHALAGDQGLARWTSLQGEEERLRAEITTLKAERDILEASLVRLRDKTMDLDYVEEIARTKLSYTRPDELLVAVR